MEKQDKDEEDRPEKQGIDMEKMCASPCILTLLVMFLHMAPIFHLVPFVSIKMNNTLGPMAPGMLL